MIRTTVDEDTRSGREWGYLIATSYTRVSHACRLASKVRRQNLL